MNKTIALMVHNLGLGDVISFSPLFFFAIDEGFNVEVVYSIGNPNTISKLILNNEVNSGKIKFVRPEQVYEAKTNYDFAIIGDRRCFGTVIRTGGRIKSVIPSPIQATRKKDIFLYNHIIRNLLRLRGIPSYPMLPNYGKSVRSQVFLHFCEVLGKSASFEDYVGSLRQRLIKELHSSRNTEEKDFLLVHLFRESGYRILSLESLDRIAEDISTAFPNEHVRVIFDQSSAWEKERASHFVQYGCKLGLECVVSSPTIEEAAFMALAAKLYFGVDHGISHLASLVCKKSFIVYGGCAHQNDMHLLWPPQIEGEQIKISKNISLINGKEGRAVLLHPSSEEYFSHSKMDSVLINKIITHENMKSALSLVE